MMASLYALGSNGSGQLGIGHTKDVSVPKMVLYGRADMHETPDIIVAGGNHTAVVSSSGKLFCAGDYSSGACGVLPKPESSSSCFKEVQFDTDETSASDGRCPIVFCAATWEATVIVRKDQEGHANRVYTFGTGNKGELGLGELLFRSSKAQLLKDFPPADTVIVDLSASMTHIIAVLSNYEVYGWGNGRKGQLGLPIGIIYSPRRVSDVDFPAVRAVCGREFTCIVGKPAEGRYTVLGADKAGIRSLGPADLIGWEDIAASWGNIFVLMQNRNLASWGRNDHGQLVPPGLPQA